MKQIKIKRKKTVLHKIFIKICRLLGYEIIDQSNLFLPVSNESGDGYISIQGKKSITIPHGVVKIQRPVKSLDIIIRTCASVKMLSQSKERLFEKEKFIYSLSTLKSIINAIKFSKDKLKNIPISITIIDHKSEKKIIDIFKSILKEADIKSTIVDLDFNKYKNQIKETNEENKKVHVNQLSNMSNINQSLELGKTFNDLIYFVEDDYIHSKESILEMVLAYEKLATQLNNELFLCPADYPYLYNETEPTSILLGDKFHWRRVNQTLCTFLTSNTLLKKYFSELTGMCKYEHYPFEKPLHKIYEKEYCFSPIPSLAMHCTNINSVYGLPPNFNWKQVWEENEFKF